MKLNKRNITDNKRIKISEWYCKKLSNKPTNKLNFDSTQTTKLNQYSFQIQNKKWAILNKSGEGIWENEF